LPAETDLFDLLAAKPDADEVLRRCAPPVSLTPELLLPPVQPASFRDFITFEQHLEGVMLSFGDNVPIEQAWFDVPTFYFSNPHSFFGPYDSIPVPPGCERFDFELEVAAVIGREGFNLSVEDAADHIVGYSILNDWSARDLQQHEMAIRLGPAKGKDTATTLGPYLVTVDELEPYRSGDRLDLAVSVAINHELVGTDSLANMAWSFEELVAYASRGTWVKPGDILGSGTTGSGCLSELWGRNGALVPPPLQVGDTVTMTVEGLGQISNVVSPAKESRPVPGARRIPRENWSLGWAR
jgi:2-keto-4-pentenoate hydratase/2-oxohepta-3-ene-1,7-dioic acid hydratase in catechol pathway